jgi:putative ABC transport system permease protein
MLANFLKITFRKLLRNKVFTLISVVGLALGISSCLFIAMYIIDELSYDQYHEKKDRIVRLSNILDFSGETNTALTNLPTGPTVLEEFPEVENYVRFRGTGRNGAELSYEDKVINLQNVWFTDSTVFDVFSYEILNGDAQNALNAPRSIVLSKETAQQFFGEEDPIGKSMKINNTFLTITAIIATPPANSEIQINALISMNTLPPPFHQAHNQDWFRIGFYTYLLFKDTPDIADFENKMVAFEEKYVQPWAEANQIEAGLQYFATPLSELHFESGKEYDLPKGNINYIYIFSLLALFILIIACINYINLSLAQSSKRAKEIGVRKTLGASRKELVGNFIGESLLLTIIAAIVGLALVELWLGTFNNVTGKSLSTMAIFSGSNLLVLIGIILGVGVLASSYPAVVLSSFQPASVLKGVILSSSGAGSIRKGLIFIQFLFSIFMITGTILINEQMGFLRSMNLGFDRENVLTINIPADTTINRQAPAWVEELRNDSRIEAVSMTNMPTGNVGQLMFRVEKDSLLREQTVSFLFIDEYFLDVVGLKLLKGRNFDRNIATDAQQAFLVNEYAAEAFGWGNEALNKRIQWGLLPNNQATNDGNVIGVVNDFHFLSLHNPMEPIILCFNPNRSNTMSIRFAKGDYTDLMKELETRWNQIAPRHPFNYTFMDEALDQNYAQEKAMSDIFNYFAFIALLIASLGLFALVSFTIQGRIKEIGIRKVVGASLPQLAWVLLKDFFILLLIAFVLTVPINFYLNNRWLESFAYDAPFNLLNYIIALLLSLILALLTVSYHIYRISKTDPVEALRYE